MRLVVDAGPIIALAKIDRLAVMEPLFDGVWMPQIVEHEVLAKPGPETRRIRAALQQFVRVVPDPAEPTISAEPLVRALDDGKKAVIRLACTLQPDVTVLMDDAAGRAVARRVRLTVLGLAGLLIKCRQNGLVDGVVPC